MKTLPELLQALATLEEEETTITESLSSALSQTEPIQISLRTLQALSQPLDELQQDTELLKNNVAQVASTARRVGNRVRQLDEEMRRVKEASDRVAQVIELKAAISDIQESFDTQDWEAATRLCARAMALPKEVVDGAFAASAVPTESSPLPPARNLQAFREGLRDVFLQQFEKAAQDRDSNSVTRFFKLFPPIGWEDEGLRTYSSFVVSLVQPKASPGEKSSSPLFYVASLTALFESVCGIVDQHQPIVEKYYGEGKMLTVVGRLITECDKSVSALVESWERDRSMDQTLAACDSRSMPLRRPGTSQFPSDDLQVQPREVDKVLNELAAIIMRVSAYRRFLYINLRRPASQSEVDYLDIVEKSGTQSIVAMLISKYYIPLEDWYLRFTINEAHRMMSTDETQSPPTSTVPDLTFYILRTVFCRLLNTGSVSAVEQASKVVRIVLEKDYLLVIKGKLEDVYKVVPPSAGVSRNEKMEVMSRRTFIVFLNDLDVSSMHVERLVKEFTASSYISQGFMPDEGDKAVQHIISIGNIRVKLRSVLKTGIEQLFNQLTRPRLRNFIPEVYKDSSYVLDEDGYTTSTNENIVQKRFLKAWQTLMEGFKGTFTENNFRLFLELVLDVILRPWEKYIMALKYSELGAIQFDRDVRSISTYLSSQIALGSVRDKFQRLQQIGTLLNVDKDESIDDFFNSSGISWKLTLAEARNIGELRV